MDLINSFPLGMSGQSHGVIIGKLVDLFFLGHYLHLSKSIFYYTPAIITYIHSVVTVEELKIDFFGYDQRLLDMNNRKNILLLRTKILPEGYHLEMISC